VVQESQTIGPFEDHGRGQGTGGDVAENASFGHLLYGAPDAAISLAKSGTRADQGVRPTSVLL
jgi:hypothetical protein